MRNKGGRPRTNPAGIRRVYNKEVFREAKKKGIELKRERISMWFAKVKGETEWQPIGMTNHLAIEWMRKRFTIDDFEKGLMLAGLTPPRSAQEIREREQLIQYEICLKNKK